MWFNPRELQQQDAISCKSSECCESVSITSPTLAKLAAPPILKIEERDQILDWLKAIDESNAEAIAGVIRRCQEDIAVCNYFLGAAMSHRAASKESDTTVR